MKIKKTPKNNNTVNHCSVKKGIVLFGPAIAFVYSANRIICYSTFYIPIVITNFGNCTHF